MKPLGDAVSAVARALGIDEGEVAHRKAFLEFGEADVHLLEFDETRRFIPDAESLDRLKRTQATYFETLTAGDYGPKYILDRLRVGIVHQRIGLEPKWYIGAYSKYLFGMLPGLWRLLHRNPQKFLDTHGALQQIVLLDMELAIDTSQGSCP